MKKLMALFSLLFIGLSAYAQTLPAIDPEEAIVKQYAAEFMQKTHTPGLAIELYIEGKPHAYYYGYANTEKKTPITEKTIFEVGSITKILTSLLLTQEVDYAKIYLNDPVKKYLTNLPDEFNDIKVQDLATHVSGLPFNTPSDITSRTTFEKYLSTWSADEAPGYAWVYSNVGMGMLGFILETETNKSFDQLYRRHILLPLHMQEIGLTVPKKLKADVAQGYDQEGKPVAASDLGLFPSAYGIKMSAGDMQKFLGAAIGIPGTPERIFYPMRMTQASYVRLDNKDQGLGWQIHSLNRLSSLLNESQEGERGPIKVQEIYSQPKFDGDTLIDKTGTTTGFRAYMAVIPNRKTGISVLANRNVSTKDVVELGRNILFKLNHLT